MKYCAPYVKRESLSRLVKSSSSWAWSTLLVCSILLAVRAEELWQTDSYELPDSKVDSPSMKGSAMKKSEIHAQCSTCQKQFKFLVPKEAHDKWRRGEGPIQDSLSMLTPGERELLISSTCEPCFDKLWDEDIDAEHEDEKNTLLDDAMDEVPAHPDAPWADDEDDDFRTTSDFE